MTIVARLNCGRDRSRPRRTKRPTQWAGPSVKEIPVKSTGRQAGGQGRESRDGPEHVRGGAAGPDGRASSGWRAAPLLPAIVETLGSYGRGGDELIEDLPNLDPARARDVFSSLAGPQGGCVGLDAALLHGLLAFPNGDGRAVTV